MSQSTDEKIAAIKARKGISTVVRKSDFSPTPKVAFTGTSDFATPEEVGDAVDRKLAEMKAAGDTRVQSVAIPGQRGQNDILIEDGTDELEKPSVANSRLNRHGVPAQIDASVPSALSGEQIAQQREARAKAPPKAATHLNMNFEKPADYIELEIGSLILRQTQLQGYEKVYTPGSGAWQAVDAGGFVESKDGPILDMLVAELQTMAEEKAARPICATCGRR